LNFTDDTWPPIGIDNYIYAVEAIYEESDAEVTFSNFIYGGTTSVAETSQHVNIYPNPFEDVININANLPVLNITIVSIAGVEIYRKAGDVSKSTIVNLQNLLPGVYYLKIETTGGLTYKKVIKN
jgi:hypothetical protein